ncbi:hypothetical protein G6F56_014130 [Rhizopus delemar]|nr:hypothetical protein G6F56_014130 [Rhizopus delemar]
MPWQTPLWCSPNVESAADTDLLRTRPGVECRPARTQAAYASCETVPPPASSFAPTERKYLRAAIVAIMHRLEARRLQLAKPACRS